jgi:hypothetical protein
MSKIIIEEIINFFLNTKLIKWFDYCKFKIKYITVFQSSNEHSEQARAPHTNGPRDVPRCGALSLLQKASTKSRYTTWGVSEFVPIICVCGSWPNWFPRPRFGSRGT